VVRGVQSGVQEQLPRARIVDLDARSESPFFRAGRTGTSGYAAVFFDEATPASRCPGERSHLRSLSSPPRGVPQVPLRLKREPDLGIPACQRLEKKRCVRTHGATSLDDRIQPLERDMHAPGGFNLRHPERIEKLLEQHFAGVSRWSVRWQHRRSSVIVGTPYIVGVVPGETEDDPVLVVHANRVVARKVFRQRVQSIPRRHSKLWEFGHGIDLIKLSG
jgi:hypothetical protein